MYNDYFYNKFLRNIENLGKVNLPDPGRYERAFENLGKVSLPDPDRYAKAFENLGKVSLPDPDRYVRAFENLGKVSLPDPDRYVRAFENLGKINVPDFDKIYSISDTFSNFPDLFSNIDWESFEITEDDIKEANDILKSDNPEEEVTKEINQKKGLPTSIKTIVIYIVLIIRFLADIVTVAEFAEERIPQIMDYYEEHIAEDTSKSDRESINWLNDELKKNVSQQITQNFRIVTKDDLAVRTGKAMDTRIKGQLNHGDVVQILEKKKNWTYVSFSNYKNEEVIDGWVFTRYLKQIK